MAAIRSYLIHLAPNFPFQMKHIPMLSIFSFFTIFVSIFSFALYKKWFKKPDVRQYGEKSQNQMIEPDPFQSGYNPSSHLNHQSLLLEIFPSDSPKWASLFVNEDDSKSHEPDFEEDSSEEQMGKKKKEKKKKKKRKRAKKKSSNLQGEDDDEKGNLDSLINQELICLYPFTHSSSATQRKIKRHHDELVKCHGSKGLTLAQVGQFAKCLNMARNELQNKADMIQRRFTIAKALLYKADRSSFDRLQKQVYKLEMEQKRLEEDAFACSWLQQQLKLSPAYKKLSLLEIDAFMELEAKSEREMENTDSELMDISFEELLAQEKKDSFWLRNGKSKSCSS